MPQLAEKSNAGMIAVDTNVVVRALAADDPAQTAAARRLFASQPIWVAKTVLIETAWVLRSSYGYDERMTREAVTRLLGLENVSVESPSEIAAALALAAQGVGIADAIHLMSRPPGSPFVSFDRSLVKRARHTGVAEVSGLAERD